MKPKLLLADDDVPFASVLGPALEEVGYRVEIARDGLEALRRLYQWHPDLVILDAMMPHMDGWETCRRIREVADIPILMLTAKGGDSNELKGLQTGADLYMTKPFSLSILMARIQALLRRSRPSTGSSSPAVVRVEELEVDLARREIALKGKPIALTPTEFRLLAELASKPGEVIPHRELLTRVWGGEYADEHSYLKMYVRYLREKIEEDPGRPRYILTRRGIGYYLNDRPSGEAAKG